MEPDFRVIAEIVSKQNGVEYTDLFFKKSRKQEVITAKFLSIYFIRKRFPNKVTTLKRIGDFFGLSHGDVIHAVRTVKEKLQVNDEIYKSSMNSLHKKIYYHFTKREANFNEIIRLAEQMPQY